MSTIRLIFLKLDELLAQGKKIMTALSDLQASETTLAAAVTAAIADITSLAQQLAAAQGSNDDAGVEAVVTQLNGLATSLQNAVSPASAAPAAAATVAAAPSTAAKS